MSEKLKSILIIINVALAVMMANIDSTIVNVALPTMMKCFNKDTSQIAYIILIYLIGMSGSVLIFGKMGDAYGNRNIFVVGFGIFTISSLFCGFSSHLWELITFRFIQGIGAGALSSSTGAIIVTSLPEKYHGKAYGTMAVFMSAGQAIGAPLGGFILQYLHWSWIFLINIPIGIFAIVLTFSILKEKKVKIKRIKFDLLGAVLSIIAASSLIVSLNNIQDNGFLSLKVLGLFIIFIVTVLFFIYWEKRAKEPIIDLNLFKNINFSSGLISKIMTLMVFSGTFFILPFYFQFVRKMDTASMGSLISVASLSMLFFSFYAGVLIDKYSARIISNCSFYIRIIAVIGFLFALPTTPVIFFVIGLLLLGIGCSLSFTSNYKVVMSNAPMGKEGMVSSINGLSVYIFQGVGLAITEAIYAFAIPKGGHLDAIHVNSGTNHAVWLFIVLLVVGLLFSYKAKERKGVEIKKINIE